MIMTAPTPILTTASGRDDSRFAPTSRLTVMTYQDDRPA